VIAARSLVFVAMFYLWSIFISICLTPLLLAWWRKREAAGFNPTPTRRMATGALIVGGAYLLLAALSWRAGCSRIRMRDLTGPL